MRKLILVLLVLACLAVVGCTTKPTTGEAVKGPEGYLARPDFTYRPAYAPTELVPTPAQTQVCCELGCKTVCGPQGDATVQHCMSAGGRAMQYGFEFTCCYFDNKPTSEYNWQACFQAGGQPVLMRVQ